MFIWTEAEQQALPLWLAVILLVSVLLGVILRRCPLWARGIPTALVALAVLFLEILKQRWNAAGPQDPYRYPFHYCSLFVAMFLLAELLGDRMSRIFRPIATAMAFVVSVAMYACPDGIISGACESFGKTFQHTHTMLLHHFIVLYFLLSVMLRLYRPRLRDALLVGAVGVLYVALALPLAYCLDENYCNLLYSVLEPLEAFRLERGQAAYTLFLSACLTLGTAFGAALHSILYKIFLIIFDRRSQDYDE